MLLPLSIVVSAFCLLFILETHLLKLPTSRRRLESSLAVISGDPILEAEIQEELATVKRSQRFVKYLLPVQAIIFLGLLILYFAS